MPPVTLRSVFQKLDRNGDGAVTRNELEAHGKEAKVDSGFLGGSKLDKATEAMMDGFDVNKDGKVEWSEFAAKGDKLLPTGAGIDLAKVKADPTEAQRGVLGFLARADRNGDGQLDRGELEAHIAGEAERAGKGLLAGMISDAGSKMAVQVLDGDGDKQVSTEELTSLVEEIAKQR